MSQNTEQNAMKQAAIAARVLEAVDDFFHFVAEFDFTQAELHDSNHFESLFSYFDEWAANVMARYEGQFYLDWRTEDKIWDSFVHLIPTIYIGVVDAYYKNPDLLTLTKVDQVTGERIIEKRTVSSVLPIPLNIDGETHESKPFLAHGAKARPEYLRIATLVVGGGGAWPEVDFKRKRRRK